MTYCQDYCLVPVWRVQIFFLTLLSHLLMLYIVAKCMITYLQLEQWMDETGKENKSE